MNSKLRELAGNIIKDGVILENEVMKNHTTFRIGGPADIFIRPGNVKEAEEILRLLCVYEEPFTVLGNGSNVLVSDEGIRGCVICLSDGMDEITCNENIIKAYAGAMLSKVAKCAFENGLSGLEFASGIPGSVGGAIYMNAGAYGGEMKDVVTRVTAFSKADHKIHELSNKEMEFGYRYSIAKDRPYIVLSVEMKLQPGKKEDIKAVMDDLNSKRRLKQPLEYPSAGSTFKRPEGYFAGKLIEDSGMRGYTLGGAQISDKHCGFVINKDNASAKDVIGLMHNVREKVLADSGVMLEPEVIFLGENMEI